MTKQVKSLPKRQKTKIAKLLPYFFKNVCEKHNIKLYFNSPNGRDGGLASNDTIWVYKSSKSWIQELSFWHELGHVLLDREKSKRLAYYLCTISREGAAWEIGLNEASKYGRIWPPHSIEMAWAREQLASYTNKEMETMWVRKQPINITDKEIHFANWQTVTLHNKPIVRG